MKLESSPEIYLIEWMSFLQTESQISKNFLVAEFGVETWRAFWGRFPLINV